MKYLILLILMFTLINCKDKKNIIYKSNDGSEKEINNWFTEDSNFEKPNYKEKFNQSFYNAIKQNDFKKSSKLLHSVINVMNSNGNFDEYYIQLIKDYLKKYETKLFKDDIFTFYFTLGVNEWHNTNYVKAIKTFRKVTALEAYNYNTFSIKGNAYYFISNTYFDIGDIDKSLEENEKALNCFNKTDNLEGQALVYHNKAQICSKIGNYDDAIKSIDFAIKICKKLKDNEGLVLSYINKYETLIDRNVYKAYPYLDTINTLIKKGEIKNDIAIIHFSGLKFTKLLNEKNIKELDELLPITEDLVKKSQSQYWENMLEIDKSKYQVLKHKKILNKDKLLNLLSFYKKSNEISYQKSIINTLKDEAIANNDLKKVLEYDKEINEYEKEIQEKDFKFKVKTYEKKIDTAKKEKIIAVQKDKLKLSYIYIGVLSFLFMTILGFFRIISLKKKRNAAIFESQRQEQFTFQLFQNTEDERSRIANELHDSVNHDLLNIKNNLINGKTIQAEEVASVIEEVRNISRNLHPAVLETVGLEASIENLCERLTDIGLFATCDIDYSQKLSKNKELQLYRIIQEALNNTLKHGKANAAKVILKSDNNSLHLEIKDNGNGFNVNEQLNNPKSFGLQSIMQRAKSIAAKININSNTNGTIILLKIPV